MIASLLEEMRVTPCCDLVWRNPAAHPWRTPRPLPGDLDYFLAHVEAGTLTFGGAPVGPEIHYTLCPDFSAPTKTFPNDYRLDFPQLDSLFELAEDRDAGAYCMVCIQLAPVAFGQVCIVHYCLGDRQPEIHSIAPSITEWLHSMLQLHRKTLHGQ
jgi:hypothetical protein